MWIARSAADISYVPYQTPCPRCAHVGLVRLEHVIKGGVSKHAFYCGSCEHTWELVDGQTPEAAPRKRSRHPRLRVREIRGGRSNAIRQVAAEADVERMARIDQIIQKLTQTQRESRVIQQRARRGLQTIANYNHELADSFEPSTGNGKRSRRRA